MYKAARPNELSISTYKIDDEPLLLKISLEEGATALELLRINDCTQLQK